MYIFNRVLKFMGTSACSLMADKANQLSKCKQSKSVLKVMTEEYTDISFKTKPIAISVLLCKLRSFNNF